MMLRLLRKTIKALADFIDPTEENNNTKKTKEAAVETAVDASRYFSDIINYPSKVAENTDKFLQNSENIIEEQPTKKDTQPTRNPLQEYEKLYEDTKTTAEKLSTQTTGTLTTIFDDQEKLSLKLDKTISLADDSLTALYKNSLKTFQTLNGTNQFEYSITDENLKIKLKKLMK